VVMSMVFFAFASSSDSSALRFLPLDLVMVGCVSAGGVVGLRTRAGPRVGAGAAPAAAAVFRGMLTNCARHERCL